MISYKPPPKSGKVGTIYRHAVAWGQASADGTFKISTKKIMEMVDTRDAPREIRRLAEFAHFDVSRPSRDDPDSYTVTYYPEGKPEREDPWASGATVEGGCARDAWVLLEDALTRVSKQAWPLNEARQTNLERKLKAIPKLMKRDRECQTATVR